MYCHNKTHSSFKETHSIGSYYNGSKIRINFCLMKKQQEYCYRGGEEVDQVD
jgi:hypothetical protein